MNYSHLSYVSHAHLQWAVGLSRWIGLLGILIGPTLAAAGGLTGTVTNAATGATLEGARVVVVGKGLEATTDGQGEIGRAHV